SSSRSSSSSTSSSNKSNNSGGGSSRGNGDGDGAYVAKVFSYCRHGRLEEVRKVLGEGFDVCGLRDENGNTLLHCAAQNGLRGMCKSVLR
ncbi:unnamed protein product, partial [Hapterophycus canaliculatus]